MTLSDELARYACELRFEDLAAEEVHGAKRCILDLLACAVGGFNGESSRIVRDLVAEVGGPPESTVIGTSKRVDCANAAFANGAMARYLDYNDSYVKTTGGFFAGWHPNELIPAALAVGERQHSSGRELIVAVTIAYEVVARFVDSIHGRPLGSRGWHMATLAGFVVPLYVGRLLGLSPARTVNALGIAGTFSPTLGVTDAPGEEYRQAKNIGIPFVARNSITAALLAQKGFTGPERVIEGNRGLIESVLSKDFDVARLTRRREVSALAQSIMKPFPAEGCSIGALTALIALVKEHDVSTEQVKSVTIELGARGAEHIGDPAKKYPQNKETADHSLFYLAAVALSDRTLDQNSYSDQKLRDPRVHALIDKVSVKANHEFNESASGAIVRILTTDNQSHSLRIDYPKGHYLNPLTDSEISEKFLAAASGVVADEDAAEVTTGVYGLEKVGDVGQLTRLLAFKERS